MCEVLRFMILSSVVNSVKWSGITVWSRDYMKSIYNIGFMMPLFWRKVIFSYICMYNGQYHAQNDLLWIMVYQDYPEHEVWISDIWSTFMDRCSPAFLCDAQIFRKSQIGTLLVKNRHTITYRHTFNEKSGHNVPGAQICDSFVWYEFSWVSVLVV